MPADPEYLTIDEAADFIRHPRATLYNWRHRRQGPPSYRVGRRILYRRDELAAWVESHRQTERPDTAA